MHSCVALNSSSCYTATIRCRLDNFPLVVVFLALYRQEQCCNKSLASQLTSDEVMSADDLSGKGSNEGSVSPLTESDLAIFHGGCSQISISSSSFSCSLYLHNWCVSSRGM